MRLLHSKLFYFILLLIIGIMLVLTFVNGNNQKNTNKYSAVNIPINFFVAGNYNNLGCLSVYVDDKEDNEYSFDNGETYQKSKYGAIYQNGRYIIYIRNKEQKMIYQKVINVNSIVNDAPIIKMNFDDSVDNKNTNELLKGVSAYLNEENLSSYVKVNILEDKDNKLVLSYFLEKDGKKCYLIREVENKKIEPTPIKKIWVWPTKKPYQITRGVSSNHKGIDIYGPNRGTPAYAARDGEIVEISSNSSSGYYVIIKHDNGYYTRYAHLQNTNGNDKLGKTSSATKYISVGQVVSAGDTIGELGGSGNSTAVHLHFEVWNGYPFKGKALNPLSFYK